MISKFFPTGYKAVLKKAIVGDTGLQDPKHCKHIRQDGDESGVSCLDCGKVLEGRGHRGIGTNGCVHNYDKDEKGEDRCRYCEGKSDGKK